MYLYYKMRWKPTWKKTQRPGHTITIRSRQHWEESLFISRAGSKSYFINNANFKNSSMTERRHGVCNGLYWPWNLEKVMECLAWRESTLQWQKKGKSSRTFLYKGVGQDLQQMHQMEKGKHFLPLQMPDWSQLAHGHHLPRPMPGWGLLQQGWQHFLPKQMPDWNHLAHGHHLPRPMPGWGQLEQG